MCLNPQKQGFLRISGRHTECACYFLNGIGLNRIPPFSSAGRTTPEARSGDVTRDAWLR